jgi:ribosome-binding protein aMBF1 (putative translation factor)
MKLKELPTLNAVLEEELRDPEFRREWERTALARAVALGVIRYRSKEGISQRRLAEILGWKPAQVARLEQGEHTPSIDTLLHLSRRLGLRFALSIGPSEQPPGVRTKKDDLVQDVSDDQGTRLLASAG